MKFIIKFLQTLFHKLSKWLLELLKFWNNPVITSFSPNAMYSGSLIEISGSNFGVLREDNSVTIGGIPARVIEASPTSLKVISAIETVTGTIKVSTGGKDAVSANSFVVQDYPLPGSGEDGPPILYEGTGFPTSGDVPPTGTMNILVCLVCPTDRVPGNPAAERTNVINRWNQVHNFYNQVTYGALNVNVTVMNNWKTLTGDFDDYVDVGIENLRADVLDRLMAESVKAAQDEGQNLNSFQMFASVIFLNGTFIRAWGGSSNTHFRYDTGNASTSIDITTTNAINQLWIQADADWGRFAHETGHNIVAKPPGISVNDDFAEKTLGEDIYASDLIDPSQASAENFDIMGSHDTHPMFSAYHMEKTGWYNSANIRELQWDRNPFSQEFNVIAHGTAQDAMADRHHLLKIKVGDGLFYYIEVRQRPTGSEYIFDTNIPVAGGHDGGVVVTKVVTDLVNNNQQMRFISLLHDAGMERALINNESVSDPARNLTITVTNDNVQAHPLVCRVRVEWAQNIADDPAGQFDLRLEPWDGNYQTPDIWIDRAPFGSFDQASDAQGRPQGNGDKPRPREINKFFTRIHNDGAIDVNNVKVTFYSVTPPGIGDNGNWSPIRTETISNIAHAGSSDISTNWTPLLGQHTCLKVFVQQQAGEISGGNNSAQENIFDFEAPSSSVPQPVYLTVALRNPLNEDTIMYVKLDGIKYGYIGQFPNKWVHLKPFEEKHLQLTVVPTLDYDQYKKLGARFKQERITDYTAHVRVTGYVPRSYKTKLETTGFPASKIEKIGGILANVKPKKKSNIEIWQAKERGNIQGKVTEYVIIEGNVVPGFNDQQVRVTLKSPLFADYPMRVFTKDGGHYSAIFLLDTIVNDLINQGKISDGKEFKAKANITAQSSIISASDLAESDSVVIAVNL